MKVETFIEEDLFSEYRLPSSEIDLISDDETETDRFADRQFQIGATLNQKPVARTFCGGNMESRLRPLSHLRF